MNHIFLLSSAEARRLWECLMDPPAVHILWDDLATLLCDLFEVERTNLFLVIPEQEQLRSRAASQFTWDIELPWDEGIAGSVYQTKTPLLINDIPESEYGHYFNRNPEGFKTRSMLTVPVFREGDENQPIVALVQLVNKIDKDFSQEDLEAIKYWCRQIGVSLERTHGTEIWRHPESEPPSLETPSFDPVLPSLATKQASLALPSFVNLLVSELWNCSLQLRKLSWSRSFWESRELINIVRNGYRHARLAHKLSGEVTAREKRLARRYRYFARLIRWVSTITRNALLYHVLTAYDEWLSFYASTFAAWLCQGRPTEHNMLYSLVEDKRSHCVFYESLLLAFLQEHPRRITEFRLYHKIMQRFYTELAENMAETIGQVAKRAELPALFGSHFHAFTEHRSQALWERALTRTHLKRTWWRRLAHGCLGAGRVLGTLFITLAIAPFALIWPQWMTTTQPFEEYPELLPQHKAA